MGCSNCKRLEEKLEKLEHKNRNLEQMVLIAKHLLKGKVND